MKAVVVRYLRPGEETSEATRSLYEECLSSIFQSIEFNRIVQEVFATELRFLVAEREGELIGICPSHLVRDNWLLSTMHSGPRMFEVPYGGWVLKDRALELSLARLLPTMFRQKVLYWSLPVVNADAWSPGPDTTKFQTLVIDLLKDNEEIFLQSIHGKRRNMIRKAERSGVEILDGSTNEVDLFYDVLLKQTNERTGILLHPKGYYRKVLEKYSGCGMAKLFMAKNRNRILAANLIVANKWFAHYWIGAKAENVENLGQGELLQWHAIQWAKRQGIRYYDLCGYEPDRLPRIAEFKSDFSRTIVPFYLVSRRSIGYRIAYRLTQ